MVRAAFSGGDTTAQCYKGVAAVLRASGWIDQLTKGKLINAGT